MGHLSRYLLGFALEFKRERKLVTTALCFLHAERKRGRDGEMEREGETMSSRV
jgi:hypothetical protein